MCSSTIKHVGESLEIAQDAPDRMLNGREGLSPFHKSEDPLRANTIRGRLKMEEEMQSGSLARPRSKRNGNKRDAYRSRQKAHH